MELCVHLGSSTTGLRIRPFYLQVLGDPSVEEGAAAYVRDLQMTKEFYATLAEGGKAETGQTQDAQPEGIEEKRQGGETAAYEKPLWLFHPSHSISSDGAVSSEAPLVAMTCLYHQKLRLRQRARVPSPWSLRST